MTISDGVQRELEDLRKARWYLDRAIQQMEQG